ncbi:MAG: hypothetical protein HOJ35_03765 [Bdellovibrionales bacterium]|nr:hypothetical protein [Bdellovibrionales bacterium]
MHITKIIIFITIFIIGCNSTTNDPITKNLNQISGAIDHLDPQVSTGLAASMQIAKSYESLMETHPYDPPFKILPNLAEEHPLISEDGLTYTFKIKKKIFYHNSPCFKSKRELIAEDFVTTFKRISDPRLVSPHFNYWSKIIVGLDNWHQKNLKLNKTNYSTPLIGVYAKSKYELVIKIKNYDYYFTNLLTSPTTSPIPIEAVNYYDNNFSDVMIGTGPFRLTKYVRKSKLEFSKNTNFRSKYFPSTSAPQHKKIINNYKGKKVPFLDKINVTITNESQTAWLNFLKGKADYLEVPKDNYSENFTNNSLSPSMKMKGMTSGASSSKSNTYYFGFNLSHPILKNRLVRHAIAYAFDHQKFNQLFFNNSAELASSLLPPLIPGNTPALKGKHIQYDIKKAKQLLVQAGFPNGEGIPPLKIMVKNKTVSRQVGQFLALQVEKIGINLNVEAVTWATLLQNAQKGNYHIFYLAWFVGIPTANEFFELLYGPNHPKSYNRVGFKNKEFDSLFNKVKKIRNIKKQNDLIKRMNHIINNKLPLLPLVHAKTYYIQHGWLKNYIPIDQYGGLEQYYDIDLELKSKLINKL